jgi:hypothetical protein
MNINIYIRRYDCGAGKFSIAEADSEAEVYTFAIGPLTSELRFQFAEKRPGRFLDADHIECGGGR